MPTQDPWSPLCQAATGPGLVAALILLLMSVTSWYLIGTRLYGSWRRQRQARALLASFYALTGPQRLAAWLGRLPGCSWQRLTALGLAQWQQLQLQPQPRTDAADWLLSGLYGQLEQERLRLENGLTALACIAACAPFVGLFGTVWGIYHALLAIGASGQSTLDKVAGPVGEALVMTGCGLLVALPAVLAYNAFVRMNRRELADLQRFTRTLHGLLVTGVLLRPLTPDAPAATVLPPSLSQPGKEFA